MNFEIGKRKVLTGSHLKELILPQQSQLPGLVIKDVGGDNHLLNSQRITLELSTDYRFPQAKDTRKQTSYENVVMLKY